LDVKKLIEELSSSMGIKRSKEKNKKDALKNFLEKLEKRQKKVKKELKNEKDKDNKKSLSEELDIIKVQIKKINKNL